MAAQGDRYRSDEVCRRCSQTHLECLTRFLFSILLRPLPAAIRPLPLQCTATTADPPLITHRRQRTTLAFQSSSLSWPRASRWRDILRLSHNSISTTSRRLSIRSNSHHHPLPPPPRTTGTAPRTGSSIRGRSRSRKNGIRDETLQI
jgi:hypothetical protein